MSLRQTYLKLMHLRQDFVRKKQRWRPYSLTVEGWEIPWRCSKERARTQSSWPRDSSSGQRGYPAEQASWPCGQQPQLQLLDQLSTSPVLGCHSLYLWHSCSTAPPAFWPLLFFPVLPLGSQTKPRANSSFSSTDSHLHLADSMLPSFAKGQTGQKSGLVVV